jgi:hypothetical protein
MEADMSKHFEADLPETCLLEGGGPSSDPQPPLAYPIEDVPAKTGLKRSKVYDAIRKKKLMARKAGRSTIIEHPELVRYLKTLPTKGREPEPGSDGLTVRAPPAARARHDRPAADRDADAKA